MIKSLAPLFHDIKFQIRHGFYIAYLFVSLVYVGFLLVLPSDLRMYVLPLIIFTDPAVLGYFFISGIFFLERDQNILENIFITTYSIKSYLFNKLISLSFISFGSSVLIVILTLGFRFNWLIYSLGVFLTAIFFTLLGFILVVRTRNLNSYLLASFLYLLIFFVPLLGYFDIYHTLIFNLIPTQASLNLIRGAFSGVEMKIALLSTLYLMTGCIITYRFAYKSIENYVVLRIGGGNK